jgi:hypothetical protein
MLKGFGVSHKSRLLRILVIFFVILLLVHDGLLVVNAQSLELQQARLLDQGKIAIFFDSVDPYCSLLAENLYRSVKTFYSRTEKIEVSSSTDLEKQLEEAFFIKSYILRGRLDGLQVGYDKVSWKDLADFLNNHRDETIYGPTVHIIASGDADSLEPFLEPYSGFYIEPSPTIDVKLSYLYHLWTISDVLDCKSAYRSDYMLAAGRNLRTSALIYFSEEFNGLVTRTIEPVETLGEVHPRIVSEVEWAKNATLRQVFPTPLTPTPEKPILGMISTTQNLKTESITSNVNIQTLSDPSSNQTLGQNQSEYVPVAHLNIKSGVNGPAGKIIDSLLNFLTNKLGSLSIPPWIGVSKSFLNQVQGYVRNFTLYLNGTVIKWFSDNLPWILKLAAGLPKPSHAYTGTAASLSSFSLGDLLEIAKKDDSARSKLGKLQNLILGECDKQITSLNKKINDWIKNKLNLKYEIKDFGVGFGDFSLFKFSFKIEVLPGFKIESKNFTRLINATIFEGKSFNWDSVLSTISIVPTLSASASVQSFGSDKNGLVKKLFELLGVTLNFTGGAKFVMELLKVQANFKSIEFLNIKEWSFKFALAISKRFTIFDFLTGGAGGGALAKAAEYIGLGHFYIDIFFKISVEIVKTAAEAGKSATSKLFLEITLGMVADLKVLIVAIKGGFEVTLRFVQDFLADTPLQIFLVVHVWFSVKIDLYLIDFDLPKWESYPLDEKAGAKGILLSGNQGSDAYKKNVVGGDTDMDGLSDDFKTMVGLKNDTADYDGDGLNDKYELDVSKTDPFKADTDGDGLSDGVEVNVYHTDPLRNDTDWDGISDYDEVVKYHTSPLLYDTDKDGLSDYYEINTAYNFTGTRVKPTVPFVIINGTKVYNHTDPLNPDTDGDGLLDGEEGVRIGPYYGKNSTGIDPTMFNFGYTHPLDYDTDDDSYEQLANGAVTDRKLFYRDMNDGVEVRGHLVNFVNTTTGETYSKVVHTNPCNPDTDNDTAEGAIFLNSDGRELSLTPPTDPTNGDTDSDGLLDGYEGTSDPYTSYHTDPNNPDTDNDKLCDGEEIRRGTNPLDSDTDHDGVCDGDEVYKYFTDPLCNDTDQDLLLDGEEIFQFYSDPLVRDSDNDTIIDGYEAHLYGTDPVNPDTDGDHLPDNIEIFILGTNPLNPDTDGDGISDLDEVKTYHTDPLNWDTDGDSITALNESGQMTLRCGDYEEIFIYHTDPLSSDTDQDGLTDGQELYLARGSPGFDPIPLDPLDNDTDHDGLIDGAELQIATTKTFLYPYTAQAIQYPYGSSPVKNDTDGDGLLDGEEVKIYHTKPNAIDTDNDTLTDYDEVHIYGTNPANNDTDGDDLADNVEIFGLAPLNGTKTDPTKSDTDGDMLPDKAELLYHTDPLNPDSDGDGVKDGAEFDYDGDGLNDGDEFYRYNTNHGLTIKDSAHSGINITDLVGHPAYLFVGGFDNPDSDMDGLTDGQEVHIYHTNATNADTDGDGFSDGEEVLRGTNPLIWTSPAPAELHVYAYDRSTKSFVNGTCSISWPDHTNSTVCTNGEIGYHSFSMTAGNYTVRCVYSEVNANNSPSAFNLTAGKIKVLIFEFGAEPSPSAGWFNIYTAVFFAAGLALGIVIPVLVLRHRTRGKNKPPTSASDPPSKSERTDGGMT